jgi:hypothetical protein
MRWFARALRFCRSAIGCSTAPRCADSTDFNEQVLTPQSRSVFNTLARGRINTKNRSTSIHAVQPANFHICDSSACIFEICGSKIESPNIVPRVCESGTGNTVNNQPHNQPTENANEECDWIVTLVTRSISANVRITRAA